MMSEEISAAATGCKLWILCLHRKCRPLKTFAFYLFASACLCLLLTRVESQEASQQQQVRNQSNQQQALIDISAQQQQQQQQANSSSNSKTTIEDDMMKLPLYMRTLATLACLVIFTIGVCGNLLVPLVVIKTKYLRNSTNLFLINLSIADLLVLIVCMPIVLIELHSRPETWLLGEPMCKLSNFIEMLAANGSIFTILAISFERYYAICKPLKAGYKCTRLRATVIIGLVWLFAFVLTSPILIMAKSSETIYIDGSLVYNCILETDTYWHKMYVFVSMFAFFCLPLLVLMLVYWLIGRRLIRENLAMSGTMTQYTPNSGSEHLQQTDGSCCDLRCRQANGKLFAQDGPTEKRAGICAVWKLVSLTGCRRVPCRCCFLGTKVKKVDDETGGGQLLPDATDADLGNMQTQSQTQIRRAMKPGKAKSLDQQHFAMRRNHCICNHQNGHRLGRDTAPGGVEASMKCKAVLGQRKEQLPSVSKVSLIDLHKFVSRLFGARPLPKADYGEAKDTTTTLQAIEGDSTTQATSAHKLAAIQRGCSNGFMMQAINEQQPLNGRISTQTGCANDELAAEPFLAESEDTSTAITGHRKQLSLGLLDGASTTLNGAVCCKTSGLLRRGRSTMNRQQLVKKDSCGSAVGSKFTRWAKRFSISSSSASMLTTTTNATAPPSEVLVDSVVTTQNESSAAPAAATTLTNNHDTSLFGRETGPRTRPLMVSRQSTGASSGEYATQSLVQDHHHRKNSSSRKRLINAHVTSCEKRNDHKTACDIMEKCTRFGSVSTTNCSSPIPSSSNISEASTNSPYSSSQSKSPSPDSIDAKQQKQKHLRICEQVEELRKESKSSLSVKDSGTFSMNGDDYDTQHIANQQQHLDKLAKVYEIANNCDNESAMSAFSAKNQTESAVMMQYKQQNNAKRNKLVSNQQLVEDDVPQRMNHNGFETRVQKLRQFKDEHKSLDIGPSSNQHHFHFNLKRSNKRSGSQPVVCNHHHLNAVSGQANNSNGSKLSDMMVVQDLSKKQQMDSRRQVVIMLAFVVACFFLLFFPYRVFTIWLILSTEAQVQSLGMETYYNLTYFSRILIYLHSAINPIAYNLISTKFRRAFMSILFCRGSSSRRHFTTEHRIINRRMTIDDHQKSLRQAASHQTR